MLAQLRPAIAALALLTLLRGLLYPCAVTGLAQVLFPPRPTAVCSGATAAASAPR